MKVFISWSGNKSHKVALVFRDWFPSVIQSIEPYVSSEDIDKGARWSTDIAKELEDSTFGILCVTKDNLIAPWLSFEAGALSKTMDKSFVSPFLFDIKRSEVHGPILQFQSTIFEKDDLKKLLKTLNKASGENSITEARLEKAFEVWYPTLEEELNKLKEIEDEVDDKKEDTKIHTAEILEEILDLSRNNQKLLRNPDSKTIESIEEIKKKIQDLAFRNDKYSDFDYRRNRKFHFMVMEDMLHGGLRKNNSNNHYGLLILLSSFNEDFPWIYDLGKDLIGKLKSKSTKQMKMEAIREYRDMLEFTLSHPMIREAYNRKDSFPIKELPFIITRYFEENNFDIK